MTFKMLPRSFRFLPLALLLWAFNTAANAELGTFGSLGEDQAAEKSELEQMRKEMNEIKGTTDDAIKSLNQINNQAAKQIDAKEIHLFCKEGSCEVSPGNKVNCLTYNGHVPGPTITAKEGQLVRIILHNQLKVPTSLHFHGMVLPLPIDGLPKSDAGLVKPGESYVYQFVAQPRGTYWYHPQIIHAEQKARGLYGAFIVEGNEPSGKQTYDQEVVVVFSDFRALSAKALHNHASGNGAANGSSAPTDTAKVFNAVALTNQLGKENEGMEFFLMNGQCAPAIPAIEIAAGTRVRLRLINAGQTPVPVHLTGHRFEVVAMNGDLVANETARDTINLGVSDRVDLEFAANNPGIWSLGSELAEQTNSGGKFPGGMACVVRYVDRPR